MSYCSNCGSEVFLGDKYCNKCGAQVNGLALNSSLTNSTSLAQQVSTRKENVSELNRMYEYFSHMESQYDEYDFCNERIRLCTSPLRDAPLVWGVLFLIFSTICLFADCSARCRDGSFTLQSLIGTLVFVSPLLIPGVVLVLVRVIKEIKRNKELKKRLARQAELATELTDYYNNFGYCLIGAEYTNPKVIAQLANIFRAGRADTIKEAINVLLDDAHKSNVELQAQLSAQAARQAANGAKTAAVFSAARFFF